MWTSAWMQKNRNEPCVQMTSDAPTRKDPTIVSMRAKKDSRRIRPIHWDPVSTSMNVSIPSITVL